MPTTKPTAASKDIVTDDVDTLLVRLKKLADEAHRLEAMFAAHRDTKQGVDHKEHAKLHRRCVLLRELVTNLREMERQEAQS